MAKNPDKTNRRGEHIPYEEKIAIIENICEIWINNPGLTLNKLLKEYDVGIAIKTFYLWRIKHEEIMNKVRETMEIVADNYVDLGQQLLDETTDPRFAVLNKIKSDYYKWRAAKLCARLYGEKFVNTDNGPVKITWVDDGTSKMRQVDS